MSLLGSIIGIGGKLLGGVLGRNEERKAINRQNEYNSPVQVRARAEEAGFNPLLFVGPGVGQQTATGGTNYMGSAIADASLMLADTLSRRMDGPTSGAVSQLVRQNERLNKKVQALTLRPKVGGIYADNVATPSLGEALGRENSGSSLVLGDSNGPASVPATSAGSDSLRPLSDNLPVDVRRPVDNAPLKTTPGFMVVDNPWVDFPVYVPTLDGDEAVDWYDYPSLVAPLAGSYGFHKLNQQRATVGPARPDASFIDAARARSNRLKPVPSPYIRKSRPKGALAVPSDFY